MVVVKDESLIKKAIDFAGNALDADGIFQSIPILKRERKRIDRRIEEIKGNRFYYDYLFNVCNIDPDDGDKYIGILAYLAF